MLPSRMRAKPKGKRYFEWYMKVAGYPKLTGLWGLSEEASQSYDMPFMFWKQKEDIPFWLRGGKDHEKEIAEMASWEKPTQDQIDAFLSQPLKAASEFDADLYAKADYKECADCYAKLLELGDPHGSTKYEQAKKKADDAVAIAKSIEGGIQCKKYGILVAELVAAFVDKAERLFKLRKGMSEFTR